MSAATSNPETKDLPGQPAAAVSAPVDIPAANIIKNSVGDLPSGQSMNPSPKDVQAVSTRLVQTPTVVSSKAPSGASNGGSANSKSAVDTLVGFVKDTLSPTKLLGQVGDALGGIATRVASDLLTQGPALLTSVFSEGIGSLANSALDWLFCQHLFNDGDIAASAANVIKHLISTENYPQFKMIKSTIKWSDLYTSKPVQGVVKGRSYQFATDDRCMFSHNVITQARVYCTDSKEGKVESFLYPLLTPIHTMREVVPDVGDIRADWSAWVLKSISDYKLIADPMPLTVYARNGIDVFDLQNVVSIIASTAAWTGGFRFGTSSALTRIMQYGLNRYFVPGNDAFYNSRTVYFPSGETDVKLSEDFKMFTSPVWPLHDFKDMYVDEKWNCVVEAVAVDVTTFLRMVSDDVRLGVEAADLARFDRQYWGGNCAVVPLRKDLMKNKHSVTARTIVEFAGPFNIISHAGFVYNTKGEILDYKQDGPDWHSWPRIMGVRTDGVLPRWVEEEEGKGHYAMEVLYVVTDWAYRAGGMTTGPVVLSNDNADFVVQVITQANIANNEMPVPTDISAAFPDFIDPTNTEVWTQVLKDWHRFFNNQSDRNEVMSILAGCCGSMIFPELLGDNRGFNDSTGYPAQEAKDDSDGKDDVYPSNWLANQKFNETESKYWDRTDPAPAVLWKGSCSTVNGFGQMPKSMNFIDGQSPDHRMQDVAGGASFNVPVSSDIMRVLMVGQMVVCVNPLTDKQCMDDFPQIMRMLVAMNHDMHYVYHAFSSFNKLCALDFWTPPRDAAQYLINQGDQFPNLSMDRLRAYALENMSAPLTHLWYVITLGSLRVNMEDNLERPEAWHLWPDRATNPDLAELQMNDLDAFLFPTIFYEDYFGRYESETVVTRSTGVFHDFATVRRQDDLKEVLVTFFEYSDEALANIRHMFYLSQEGLRIGTVDPFENSVMFRTYKQNVFSYHWRKMVNFYLYRFPWTFQRIRSLTSAAIPERFLIDASNHLTVNAYWLGSQPTKTEFMGLYSMYGGFLNCTSMQIGERTTFSMTGGVKMRTEGLVAPDTMGDDRRGLNKHKKKK